MPELTTRTRALIVILKPWEDFEDDELPRHGHGYRDGMTAAELEASARGWWDVLPDRAMTYEYIVAAHKRVTRGVWALDPSVSVRRASPQLCKRLGMSGRRYAFGVHAAPPEIWDAFVGMDGRRLPFRPYRELRYWPI